MKCPHCGTVLPIVNGYYCSNCGETLPFDTQPDRTGITNIYALAGFITACIGLFANLLGIMPIISLVLSVKGLRQIRETGENGRLLAIAGIILSCIGIIIFLALLALILFFWGTFPQILV